MGFKGGVISMNGSARHDESRIARRDLDPRMERDALRTRVRILESALACIGREAQVPLKHPETSFMVVHRIASVVRQAVEPEPPPASTRRPIVPTARL